MSDCSRCTMNTQIEELDDNNGLCDACSKDDYARDKDARIKELEEQLAAATEWRDIDSAPKDARDVHVYCDDTKEQFIAFYDTNDDHWIFACSSGGVKFVCKPTHWKSKSPAPTEIDQ